MALARCRRASHHVLIFRVYSSSWFPGRGGGRTILRTVKNYAQILDLRHNYARAVLTWKGDSYFHRAHLSEEEKQMSNIQNGYRRVPPSDFQCVDNTKCDFIKYLPTPLRFPRPFLRLFPRR